MPLLTFFLFTGIYYRIRINVPFQWRQILEDDVGHVHIFLTHCFVVDGQVVLGKLVGKFVKATWLVHKEIPMSHLVFHPVYVHANCLFYLFIHCLFCNYPLHMCFQALAGVGGPFIQGWLGLAIRLDSS